MYYYYEVQSLLYSVTAVILGEVGSKAQFGTTVVTIKLEESKVVLEPKEHCRSWSSVTMLLWLTITLLDY